MVDYWLGWAITGACPGPLYAQIGTGATGNCSHVLSAAARYLGVWKSKRASSTLAFYIAIIPQDRECNCISIYP